MDRPKLAFILVWEDKSPTHSNNFLSLHSFILSTVGTNHYRFSTRWFVNLQKLLFSIYIGNAKDDSQLSHPVHKHGWIDREAEIWLLILVTWIIISSHGGKREFNHKSFIFVYVFLFYIVSKYIKINISEYYLFLQLSNVFI